jgi:hypothetical protein
VFFFFPGSPFMPPPVAARTHRYPRRLAAFTLIAAAFTASLFLNTRHITFPYGFHPDEPDKSGQILSERGYRNFRHPQLMLEVTQRIYDLGRTPRDVQDVTVLGRRVSAVFAALGVAAICLTGYLTGGLSGAFLLGLSTLFCSSLIVYAHYFKEDAALAMGLCLVLLAIRCLTMARSRSAISAAVFFLAWACAIAASAKYIGTVFLLAGAPIVMIAPATHWRYRITRLAMFLLTFAFFTAAINYRVWIDPSDFENGFGYEANHVVTSHFGIALNCPNSYYLANLPVEVGWPIVILAAAAIPMLCITWRRRSAWDITAILIALGFLLVLSLSSIPNTRYLLPIVVMLHVMAALLALWSIELFSRPAWRFTVGFAFAAIITFIGLPRCISVVHQFGDDSRDRLRAWIIANLPPNSIVVGDFYTGLVAHTRGMHGQDTIGNNITVREAFAATRFGPLASLPQKGISYVAVADPAYERYFQPQLHPTDDFQQQYDENRQWYEDLFANHKPIWEFTPEMNLHSSTNPAIRLYRINSP